MPYSGIPYSALDSRYLVEANNLSDLTNAGTARTNLGLVAGGAGDVWVEKAGDAMTGALSVDVNSATGLLVEQDGVNDDTLIVDTASGRVGVNVAPVEELTVLGRIMLSESYTDNTNKAMYVVAQQYDSDGEAEGYTLLFGYSNASNNTVDFGGGSSQANAANAVRFITGANTTTRTGTTRVWIDYNGKAGFGDVTSSAGLAQITSRADLNALDGLSGGGNYHLHVTNRNDNNAEEVGIAFSLTSHYSEVGAAITHHRIGASSQGQLRFYTKNSTSALAAPVLAMVLDENQNAGFGGVTAPAAQMHVDQASSSGAMPVLTLDQADIDLEFIKFIGSSEDGVSDRSLVDAVDMTTPGALTGWIQVYIEDIQGTNPITDGVYYIPFYAAPAA